MTKQDTKQASWPQAAGTKQFCSVVAMLTIKHVNDEFRY